MGSGTEILAASLCVCMCVCARMCSCVEIESCIHRSFYYLQLIQTIGAELDMEIFPGLILKLRDPTVTMLIFVNGKIVITGAASQSIIVSAFEKMFPVLLLYKRD